MTQQANNPTLERLMQAAQTGDARAYECLLSDITPRLRRMIQSQRRFLGPDEIEDILQDVLISMHSVRATYDPQRPFMPWLLAITRNRLADGGRKWARRAANEVLVDEVLRGLSPLFEEMYAQVGRPSIPPERLLKASLLMALYTVRSERLLCEQLGYNFLSAIFST